MDGGVRLFFDFINDFRLRDVPISGAAYTWLNFQNPPSMSKLDGFLLLAEWDNLFPLSKGLARPRPVSDHIPLVLCEKMINGDPKPFKFENMWLQSPNFVDLVKSWWGSFSVTGKPGQRLWLKLKLLREKLRTWNKEIFQKYRLQEKTIIGGDPTSGYKRGVNKPIGW